MRLIRPLLALLWLAGSVAAQSATGDALVYSAASIVHAATNQSGVLAPNTLATVYGLNLSRETRALGASDIQSGSLPSRLAGVTVAVNDIPAGLYFVSPRQINFVVPGNLRPGPATIEISRDSRRGPSVRVELEDTAPGFFEMPDRQVIATRADGSLITQQSPAIKGEVIVFYATGLGRTSSRPVLEHLRIPQTAQQVVNMPRLEHFLGGQHVHSERILNAGLNPGFVGLYHINVVVPETIRGNLEVRLGLGDSFSPAGLTLPLD